MNKDTNIHVYNIDGCLNNKYYHKHKIYLHIFLFFNFIYIISY